MKATSRHDLTVKMTPVADLQPWDRNPRSNDQAAERLAYTISEHGWTTPILARPGGQIIAGHTRFKAALKLGLEEVPVITLDVSDSRAVAIAIADNRLGELAEWDEGGLADLLREMQEQEEDLSAIGYEDDDLAEFLAEQEEEEQEDDFEDHHAGHEEEGEPQSEPGKIYELGPHRLICGSCRDEKVVRRLLLGVEVEMAFTSPPYAQQRDYDHSSGFQAPTEEEFTEWFAPVQAAVAEHLSVNGSWFVNIKEHTRDGQRVLYVKELVIDHVRRWGWRFVDEFCWQRNAFPGKFPDRLKNGWEPVFHFSKGKPKVRHKQVQFESDYSFEYDPAIDKTIGKDGYVETARSQEKRGMVLPSNVINVSKGATGVDHPAMFPVKLPAWFMRAFSDKGQAVYDPFMGGGSTILAAQMEGRVAYGCEISPRYCDVIRKRWGDYARKRGIEPGSGAL